jgi:hypothetical protein
MSKKRTVKPTADRKAAKRRRRKAARILRRARVAAQLGLLGAERSRAAARRHALAADAECAQLRTDFAARRRSAP